MRRLAGLVGAAGLIAGSATGCGPEKTATEARVVGFAFGIDATVIQDEWVHYTGKSSLPRNTQVRLNRQYEVVDHCREVENGIFDLGFDDEECWFDFSCSSTDTTHCEAVYEDRYDYEQLEPVPVLSCPAPMIITPNKPTTASLNTSCTDQMTEAQRLQQRPRYLISIRVANPYYDAKDNPREVLSATFPVSPQTWAQMTPGGQIEVLVTSDQAIEFP